MISRPTLYVLATMILAALLHACGSSSDDDDDGASAQNGCCYYSCNTGFGTLQGQKSSAAISNTTQCDEAAGAECGGSLKVGCATYSSNACDSACECFDRTSSGECR